MRPAQHSSLEKFDFARRLRRSHPFRHLRFERVKIEVRAALHRRAIKQGREGDAVTSPVGGDAARAAAIPLSEGFNLGYCKARPGHGPMMHNHDTNETFIPMTGKWRCSWENEMGEVEHVDLDPLDVISFPPGAIRRFENVTSGDRDQENILMFVIGGNGPRAEFTDEAMQELAMAGVWPSKAG